MRAGSSRGRREAGAGKPRRRAIALAAWLALAAGLSACARLQSASDSTSPANLSCRQASPPATVITWWSAATDHDRDDLAEWCQTVGPVVFHSPQQTRALRDHDTLAVVSWNLHVGAGDVDALIRALRAGDFTAGKPANDFVLLLQEAYRRDDAIPAGVHFAVPSRIAARRGRGPDVSHLWRDDALSLLYAPSMRNGLTDVDREDRGNAIASTLPLEQPTLLELPLQHQRRVVATAVVEGRTSAGVPWAVRVADVHLDTALAVLHGGPFAARRRQAESLVAGLAATAPDAHRATTIVAGDFNTVMGASESAVGYLRSVFPDGPAPLGVPTFSGPLGFHATLDHVFVGGRVKSVDVKRLPGRFGSDHYPLLTVIGF